jgi:hypothetical protein
VGQDARLRQQRLRARVVPPRLPRACSLLARARLQPETDLRAKDLGAICRASARPRSRRASGTVQSAGRCSRTTASAPRNGASSDLNVHHRFVQGAQSSLSLVCMPRTARPMPPYCDSHASLSSRSFCSTVFCHVVPIPRRAADDVEKKDRHGRQMRGPPGGVDPGSKGKGSRAKTNGVKGEGKRKSTEGRAPF